jgi:hypothetical protein
VGVDGGQDDTSVRLRTVVRPSFFLCDFFFKSNNKNVSDEEETKQTNYPMVVRVIEFN